LFDFVSFASTLCFCWERKTLN